MSIVSELLNPDADRVFAPKMSSQGMWKMFKAMAFLIGIMTMPNSLCVPISCVCVFAGYTCTMVYWSGILRDENDF